MKQLKKQKNENSKKKSLSKTQKNEKIKKRKMFVFYIDKRRRIHV